MIKSFKKRYIYNEPLTYYVVIGNIEAGQDWIQIDPIVTDHPIYCPAGSVAIFTVDGLRDAKIHNSHLELLCLSCFLHILRKGNRIRSAILDGKYQLKVMPWRVPCETTAIYIDSNETYYLEGCRDTGVFWRSSKTKPRTVPPFISCGALDSNGGCWWEKCPNGAYFEDDMERFDLM